MELLIWWDISLEETMRDCFQTIPHQKNKTSAEERLPLSLANRNVEYTLHLA